MLRVGLWLQVQTLQTHSDKGAHRGAGKPSDTRPPATTGHAPALAEPSQTVAPVRTQEYAGGGVEGGVHRSVKSSPCTAEGGAAIPGAQTGLRSGQGVGELRRRTQRWRQRPWRPSHQTACPGRPGARGVHRQSQGMNQRTSKAGLTSHKASNGTRGQVSSVPPVASSVPAKDSLVVSACWNLLGNSLSINHPYQSSAAVYRWRMPYIRASGTPVTAALQPDGPQSQTPSWSHHRA
jgi:hypothetical protein